MKLLAINTANIEADLCLKNENTEICKKIDSSLKHSESVMVEIDKLLYEQNLKINDLDSMALIVGPGSFTGIRIGIALSKGFELVNTQMKLISITSFEFLKYEFLKLKPDFKEDYACVFNALSGKYYVQLNQNGVFQEPFLTSDVNDFIGYKTILGLKEENLPFVTNYITLNSQTLLDIAKEKFEKNDFVSEFVPLYLRKSQAEDELEGKKNV